jgi:hypothetical protein
MFMLDKPQLPRATTVFAEKIQNITTERLRKFYEDELAWAERIRHEAVPLAAENKIRNEDSKMEFAKIAANGQNYVTVISGQITAEEDGLAIISACAEHSTNLVLLPTACLSEDFLRLSTRLLGLVLQKLGNYRIKASAVLDVNEQSLRMKEFLYETNQGSAFRAFDNFRDAENWLTGGNVQ